MDSYYLRLGISSLTEAHKHSVLAFTNLSQAGLPEYMYRLFRQQIVGALERVIYRLQNQIPPDKE